MSSSILNLFLQGDGTSGACSGSVASWLCIAVPQRSAHFPTLNHALLVVLQIRVLSTSQIGRENARWRKLEGSKLRV